MHSSLSATPICVSRPRSAPRFCATRLWRAVISATWKPKRRSCTRPWPSSTLKDLDSLPSLSKYSRPSVSVPSTSRHTRRTWRARSAISGAMVDSGSYGTWVSGGIGALNHACSQQVVNIERADRAVLRIDHDQAVDAMALHQVRGFGRHLGGVDGAWVAGHDLGDARLAHVDAAVQCAAQVAVGEDAGQ